MMTNAVAGRALGARAAVTERGRHSAAAAAAAAAGAAAGATVSMGVAVVVASPVGGHTPYRGHTTHSVAQPTRHAED